MSIVKRFTFSLLLLVGLVLAPLPARAASVSPVWTNDTTANTLTFQDTFGHNVQLGTYNPGSGAWTASVGVGAVTSLTWTGGLVSIANPTTTPAFTVAGTSGGIPYFSSGTTWASSAALAAGGLVVGGGAGAAPASIVLAGDCTLASPNVTCTKTSGVAFSGLATATIPLSIANGGTGQATANPAFNALSPMTTAGDLIYGGAAGVGTRLAAGTASQFLNGGSPPAWTTIAGDCTFAIPNITCTKTGGVAFGTFATQSYATPPAIGGTTPAAGTFLATAVSTLTVGAPGMVGDGVTDNATNFQSALTAVASGGYIHLPCGKFKVSSAALSLTLAAGKHLTLEGSGHECTKIFFSTASSALGLKIIESDLLASVTIRGMSFTTDQATGTNEGLILQNPNQNAVPYMNQNNIEDVVMRGDDGILATDYFGTAFDVANIGYINFENVQTWGNASLTVSTGVLLSGKTGAPTGYAVVANFNNVSMTGHNVGIYYNSYFQGVSVANSNFTGDQYGIYIPSGASGILDQLLVTTTQFACYKAGITELSSLPDTVITGNYFNWVTGTGIHGIDLLATRATVTGNSFYGAAQPTAVGVNINAACVACDVFGNTFTNLTTGISAASGANGFATGNTFNTVTANFGGTFTSAFAVYGNNNDIGFKNFSPAGSVTGTAAATGTIGEVIRSNIAVGSAVALTTAVAKTVTSISLTAGDWDCRGGVGFNPNAATTISLLAGSVSTVNNTLSGTPGTEVIEQLTYTTGGSAMYAITSFQVNISATQTEYLVAQSNFGVNTQAAYGFIECRRMQ